MKLRPSLKVFYITVQSATIENNKYSPSGNRTPVFRVTGGDTVHYTNEEGYKVMWPRPTNHWAVLYFEIFFLFFGWLFFTCACAEKQSDRWMNLVGPRRAKTWSTIRHVKSCTQGKRIKKNMTKKNAASSCLVFLLSFLCDFTSRCRGEPIFNRPQQLCEKEMSHCTRWITPDTDLSDPWEPPTDKTAHFREAFYCEQPKAHLCTDHNVLNERPDAPHLSGGWIILAKEKCSLTQI